MFLDYHSFRGREDAIMVILAGDDWIVNQLRVLTLLIETPNRLSSQGLIITPGRKCLMKSNMHTLWQQRERDISFSYSISWQYYFTIIADILGRMESSLFLLENEDVVRWFWPMNSDVRKLNSRPTFCHNIVTVRIKENYLNIQFRKGIIKHSN